MPQMKVEDFDRPPSVGDEVTLKVESVDPDGTVELSYSPEKVVEAQKTLKTGDESLDEYMKNQGKEESNIPTQ